MGGKARRGLSRQGGGAAPACHPRRGGPRCAAPRCAALQLVEVFGSTRDEWIESDLEGWLAPNRIYPGVAEAVRRLMEEHEVYIVTTKQARPRFFLNTGSR